MFHSITSSASSSIVKFASSVAVVATLFAGSPGMVHAATVATQARPQSDVVTLRVGRIYKLQVVRGQQQWGTSASRQFASAIWQFDDQGNFSFRPTQEVAQGLYPLRGKFTRDGDTVRFSASSSSRTGYSASNNTMIQGEIDLSGDAPIVTMYWIKSSGMSAVVNNTGFSQASTAAYYIQAELTGE